jgi:putative acetyltransferase
MKVELMQIRLAEVEDIDSILAVRMHSIKDLCTQDYNKDQLKVWATKGSDRESVEREIARGNVFIVVEDATVQGYVHMRMAVRAGSNSSAHLEGIFISKARASQGFGKQLLEKAEELTRKRSFAQIKVTVSKTAVGFFSKLGYEILGPNLRRTIEGQVLEFQPLFKKLRPPEKVELED